MAAKKPNRAEEKRGINEKVVTEEEKPRELFSDGVEKSERDAAAEHATIWKSMEEQPDERDQQLEIRETNSTKGPR